MFGSPTPKQEGYLGECNAVLVGKCEGNTSAGRHKCRRDDTIKIYFQRNRMRASELDSSGSRYGKLVGSCEDGNEHSVSIKCGNFLAR